MTFELFSSSSFKDRQSSALANYFNKPDRDDKEDVDDDDEKTPWDEMGTNDWGDTQEIIEDKWDDFSSATSSTTVPQTSTKTTMKSFDSTAWVQEKAAPSKNDWDTDAFFNDVLTTSNKPKLKTTRRQ